MGEDLDPRERDLLVRNRNVTDGLDRLLRTAAKVVAVVIVTLLVLTAIGWVIRTVGDGPDESDVTTLEG